MSGLEKLDREQLIALVERLQSGDVEEDEGPFNDVLTRSTGNPHVLNLIFYPEPGKENMTAEEIVDEALSYHPIEL